jgi:hypothetical protein
MVSGSNIFSGNLTYMFHKLRKPVKFGGLTTLDIGIEGALAGDCSLANV